MAGAKCAKCSNVTFANEDADINGTKYTLMKCSSCGSVFAAIPKGFWHVYNTVDQIQSMVSDIYKKVFNI